MPQPNSQTTGFPAPLQAPSDHFEDAFRFGGTSSATCSFCSRIYFSVEFMEDDEIEQMRRYAESMPERYIEVSDDTISVVEIDGATWVMECPCNGPRRFEDFIWNHRQQIARYLKARTESEVESGNALLALLQGE